MYGSGLVTKRGLISKEYLESLLFLEMGFRNKEIQTT